MPLVDPTHVLLTQTKNCRCCTASTVPAGLTLSSTPPTAYTVVATTPTAKIHRAFGMAGKHVWWDRAPNASNASSAP